MQIQRQMQSLKSQPIEIQNLNTIAQMLRAMDDGQSIVSHRTTEELAEKIFRVEKVHRHQLDLDAGISSHVSQ